MAAPKRGSGHDRAVARQQKKLDAYDALYNDDWKITEKCHFCGKDFIVNNYPGHKVHVPLFKGRPICPWCCSMTVANRFGWRKIITVDRYKTLMSRVIVDKLAALPCIRQGMYGCKCLSCAATKLMEME